MLCIDIFDIFGECYDYNLTDPTKFECIVCFFHTYKRVIANFKKIN